MTVKTTNSPAFGGRVEFRCRHITPRIVAQAEAFAKIAREKFPEYGEIIDVGELSTLVNCTPEIVFDYKGDEMPMLLELKEFWEAYIKLPLGEDAVKLALEWRAETFKSIRDEWVDAVNAALSPFRDPVTLPGSHLTVEERAKVQNPDDPLPSPGENSGDVPAAD